MSKSELLIDWVYRGTFKKPRMPTLREHLIQARRVVLDDGMAAFLYSLMLEIYGYHDLTQNKDRWLRRAYDRLDDCRYFSRLPHQITWVEYGVHAMLQREIAERLDTKTPYCQPEVDLGKTLSHGTRVGWLFKQHHQVDTAFSASYFYGGIGDDGQSRWADSAVDIVWCVDDAPLPWPKLIARHPKSGMSASEYVTNVRDYDRANVAMRFRGDSEDGYNADQGMINALHGRARMMWAFLATFNKVPVVGATQVVPVGGFVARGSHHKFLEHKVLTINIPEKKGMRLVVREVLSFIRRRAHEVRGHFRDDWRLPRGNKRLWIPPHQRGDASLGFVTHEYAVKHEP